MLGKGKMVRWMLAEEGRETAAEVGREKDADTGREKLDAERRSVLSSRCLSQGWMGLCGRREVLYVLLTPTVLLIFVIRIIK